MKFIKTKNEELGRYTAEDFKGVSKLPYILVLEDIRSLLNVGSIFRTADAFRAQGVMLVGITGRPPHKEIQKTALGATETVKWEYYPDVKDLIKRLKADGYLICVVEQTKNSISPSEMSGIAQPIAVILGNEVDGVSETAISMCDFVIEIPQGGTKHSLNVSVAAGIICWELYSRLSMNNHAK